ncbi:MerR family transcriptional regulator [Gracilibacillus oryzae]|uniref:MerR family transcriptional regulator n=1 Tax=Gracilibacillus oryzae TaxID=1672701 RepID=A0A7C8L0Z5_9BACI|nr:MerR family transcriptional regulator [Gracilibacillus oryzae]KAB8126153.1 MerR family transcriptional regulator [Gracilibacillus oryzae]
MKEITEAFMSIKEAAEFSGLSEATIRYYEKIGLLPFATRKANGHRTYSKQQIEGILFLTRLKRTGMKLEEIKHFLQLFEAGPTTIQQRISILEDQRKKINEDISQLMETKRIIEYKIKNYNETLVHPVFQHSNC